MMDKLFLYDHMHICYFVNIFYVIMMHKVFYMTMHICYFVQIIMEMS